MIFSKFTVLIFAFALVIVGCAPEQTNDNILGALSDIQEVPQEKNTILIAGEGGPSGTMILKAAETYKKENGGEIYEVHSGDEFISAINDFIDEFGQIDHMQYFGHGNSVGLYVNQAPNVNGALYANDTSLNSNYISASIYELDSDIFAKNGWIKFNGCNVAEGFPENNTLAQSFANYFDVDVVAPTGPTEFSKNPDNVDPIENTNYLSSDFNGDVYMVPTYDERSFVNLTPQNIVDENFEDLREGQSYTTSALALIDDGLNLNFGDKEFFPYKNISYAEAREFCRIAVDDISKCVVYGYDDNDQIRNLGALKMLADAYGISLKNTNPWYNSYIWWASNENLLTKDFTNRKWYTRGEMAELTYNFMQKF